MDDAVHENLEEIVLHAQRAVGLRAKQQAPIAVDDWQSLYLASRIRKKAPDVLNQIDRPWFQIIAARHIVAHSYESIDPARIDEILTDKLPDLIRSVSAYLDASP